MQVTTLPLPSLAALLVVAGCSSAPLKLPDDNLERTGRMAAYSRDFPNTPYDLVYIPSRGGASNSITLATLRSGVGSANSRKLGALLRESTAKSARVVVTGPDDELTAETLLDALGRLEGRRLDGFHIAYVGAPGYKDILQAAVSPTGAAFAYVRHPRP